MIKNVFLTLAMLINEAERRYGKLYVDFAGKIICDFTEQNKNDKNKNITIQYCM